MIGKSGYVAAGEKIKFYHVNECKMAYLLTAATASSGDVFVLDITADGRATPAQVRAAQRPVVVAAERDQVGTQTVPAGTYGWFQAWGQCARVNLTKCANRGDWLITAATGKLAEPISSEGPPLGAFAFALTVGSSPVAFLLGGLPSVADAQDMRPVAVEKAEQIPIAPNGDAMICYDAGPGELESLWLTFECTSPPSNADAAWKHQLLIKADGSVCANTTVGNFFASVFGAPQWTTNRMGCTKMDKAAGKSSFYRLVKIPFSQYLEVTVKNVASATALFSGQVGVREGVGVQGLRDRNFRSCSRSGQTVAEYAAYTLISAAPAKRGWIEGFMLAVDANTNWDFLKGRIEIWTDGIKRAEYAETADAFLGRFDAAAAKWQTDISGLTKLHAYTESVPFYQCCFYRFFDKDPLRFNNDMEIIWYNGKAGQGSPGPITGGVYSEVWYYLAD